MSVSSPTSRNVSASVPYTSDRAARKIVLSRRPISASTTSTVATGRRERAVAATTQRGAASRRTARRRRAVRQLPRVPGTRSGHGGSRMVRGRSQYRNEPSGGVKRRFSGPKPQPSPSTSNSIVQSDELVEHDRVAPPVADGREAVDARGRQHERQPTSTYTAILKR